MQLDRLIRRTNSRRELTALLQRQPKAKLGLWSRFVSDAMLVLSTRSAGRETFTQKRDYIARLAELKH